MDPEIELHAIFQGSVQGVGFRWQILDHAKAYRLKGTVKNLLNGAVEVVAQGSKEDLENFLRTVQEDPGGARIEHVKCHYRNPTSSFSDFRIVH